jgi:multidrug efflux pump
VLAIVVVTAPSVVENVERLMATGLAPREATIKAMDEITGPVIAITLVLCSVFVPTGFIAGISGQFSRQFALTIAASTVISAINALTLSPALAAQILKAHDPHHHEEREALPRPAIAFLVGLILYSFLAPKIGLSSAGHGHEAGDHGGAGMGLWALRLIAFGMATAAGWSVSRWINRQLDRIFVGFNGLFDRATNAYGGLVRGLLRMMAIVFCVYGGFLFLTYLGFGTVPVGFIPDQDKGYLVVNAQLPDGASLERTEEVMARVTETARNTPGVAHTISLPGCSVVTGNNISNVGACSSS